MAYRTGAGADDCESSVSDSATLAAPRPPTETRPKTNFRIIFAPSCELRGLQRSRNTPIITRNTCLFCFSLRRTNCALYRNGAALRSALRLALALGAWVRLSSDQLVPVGGGGFMPVAITLSADDITKIRLAPHLNASDTRLFGAAQSLSFTLSLW